MILTNKPFLRRALDDSCGWSFFLLWIMERLSSVESEPLSGLPDAGLSGLASSVFCSEKLRTKGNEARSAPVIFKFGSRK